MHESAAATGEKAPVNGRSVVPEQVGHPVASHRVDQRVQPGEPTLPDERLVIGRLVGFGESGAPVVRLDRDEHGRCLSAQSLVPLHQNHLHREVVVDFAAGDPPKPIIMGLLQLPDEQHQARASDGHRPQDNEVGVSLDNERLVLTADREIVLRCGKASITLTRAGKVLIRGAYLLSRSSGVNRIKGGSVQIN